jgi:MFS family permease
VSEQIHDIGRRRAWVIWVVALSVYGLAVFHRSSLGVAGLLAADRFGIAATELSLFTVVQLTVYAGMQVPVGVLLDRYGSKKLLIAGLVLMTAGQLAFAYVTSFPAAVGARALMGAGDSMVFVSVIRLVVIWFTPKQSALVTQMTGQIGQLGGIAAAAPLSWALHELGWTRTFAFASTLGLFLLAGVLLVVKDSPFRADEIVKVRLRALAASVRTVWGNPGTRLGMWSHFTAPFAVSSFAMLWGFPFLVRGQEWSQQAAATLLMAMILWAAVSGFLLGVAVGRFPFWRSWIVITVVTSMALAWAAVLLRTTPAPAWLMVLTVFLTATGGPASMVAFDLARTFTPVQQTGRANGIVNVGGFVAALACMAAIGIVLDLREPAGMEAYDLADFRVAMSVQYVFWAFGVAQILRYRRKGLDHLRRMHPGAIEQMRRGEAFVHPGFNEREGV